MWDNALLLQHYNFSIGLKYLKYLKVRGKHKRNKTFKYLKVRGKHKRKKKKAKGRLLQIRGKN